VGTRLNAIEGFHRMFRKSIKAKQTFQQTTTSKNAFTFSSKKYTKNGISLSEIVA